MMHVGFPILLGSDKVQRWRPKPTEALCHKGLTFYTCEFLSLNCTLAVGV